MMFLLLATIVVCIRVSLSRSITCSISEQSPVSTFVCDLSSKIGYDYTFKAFFELGSNENSHYFKLNSSTGLLHTAKVIDREQIRSCRSVDVLECELSLFFTYLRDKSDRSSLQYHDLTVTINDINDNWPKFSINPVQSTVKEHQRNSIIPLPSATDPDAGRNGTIIYTFPQHILHRSQYTKFTIEDDKTRGLGLKVIGDINIEMDGSPIYLIVQARDDAVFPKVSNLSVKIDVENVNDYSPVFDHTSMNPTVSIAENVSSRHRIIQLNATDRDVHIERLRYSLVSGPDTAHFMVDEMSGLVRLKDTVDAEMKRTYRFQVSVSDNHHPDPKVAFTTVTVNIEDINDNLPEIVVRPVLQKEGLAVLENQQPVMIAAIEVSDRDFELRNSRVECDTAAFDAQTTPNAFSLFLDKDRDSGRFKRYLLKNTRSLDREERSQYELHLTCTDSAGARNIRSFIVRILDENDSKPMFLDRKVTFKLRENKPSHTHIGFVVATDADANSRISYEVLEPFRHVVNIGKLNGSLYSLVSFDRERNSSFHCVVRAYDSGREDMYSLVDVEIKIEDVNDNSPKFRANYTFNIAENTLSRDIGQVEAVDSDLGDNGQVYYTLVQQSYGNIFRINSNGKLYSTTSTVDRERIKKYTVVVEARDQGRPPRSATTTVTINVMDQNDQSPRFLFPSNMKHNGSLNVSILESVNSVVAKIVAIDDDDGLNGRVQYFIENSVNCGGLFRLDLDSGELKLARQITSMKQGEQCRIHLRASDQGSPRKETRQSLIVHFTGSPPHALNHDSNSSSMNGSSTLRLIIVTVCIILSILVIFCVVVLVSYFCYYVKDTSPKTTMHRNNNHNDNWLSQICWPRPASNHGNNRWRRPQHNIQSGAPGSLQISKPLIVGDIAKFRTAERYCMESSPDSGRGTDAKFINNKEDTCNNVVTYVDDGALYQNTDYQTYNTKSYYKSLRTPELNQSDEEDDDDGVPPRLVHYLVDKSGNKTVGAVMKEYGVATTPRQQHKATGYVYGSPYLTSSFV